MRILLSLGILVSCLASQATLATATLTVEEVVKKTNPIQALQEFSEQHPQETVGLCEEILGNEFYSRADAVGASRIKYLKLPAFCQEFKIKMQKEGPGKIALPSVPTEAQPTLTKPMIGKKLSETVTSKFNVVPEEPVLPKPRAKVVLKAMDFAPESKSVQEEQANLKKADLEIKENLARLAEEADLIHKEKIVRLQMLRQEAEAKLATAQERYDHLSMILGFMREDLGNMKHDFKVFNPDKHQHDSHEQYMEALEQALPMESPHILTPRSQEYLQTASQLLKEANALHSQARLELESIKRDMLELG